ncbi:hypothetical protein SteCoe_3516 [Stentor coeruleus]|uniref:Uncharacterized protein n=1 Tax=Stentor coeruleus TaxID=5963 RepID=A0A1R2CX14_9CILI|nr:hypothetical protein SteCoe_3516 [Stentor coeruleus]
MDTKVLELLLEKESGSLYALLEKEFINLKFKAAKCARSCFETKKIPGAFQCENQCMNSIKKAMNFVQTHQSIAEKNLKSCVDIVIEGREGSNSHTKEALEGPSFCYEEYLKNLRFVKEEAEKEFSYYV